jgi:hypothetical protein
MKTLIICTLILISSSFLVSCSDNTVSPTGTNSNGYITDKVENWTLGNKNICAYVYGPGSSQPVNLGNGSISFNGNFSIQFNAPSEEYLETIDNFFDEGSNKGIKLNPTDVKYAVLVLSVLDTNGSSLGLLERRNYTDNLTENSFYTSYLYFNKDVSVTGTKLNEYPADTTFSEYNVTSNMGWSLLTCLYNKLTYTYTSYTIKNSEPQGGKWFYFDTNDKSLRLKGKHKIR